MNEFLRFLGLAIGSTAIFGGTTLLGFGVYAVIVRLTTDDPIGASWAGGFAPALIVGGLIALAIGIAIVRGVKKKFGP